ncbi:MAG: LptE family protein [candidate division KSB1 bacterium]|nr:LptE family protein [candidate division KSB1 bacterium]
MIRANYLFVLLLSAVLCVSCSYYSVKGSLPAHLKTVAIPLLENNTAEFGVVEELTDALITEFTRDGSLRITNPEAADVLIRGTITNINERAGAFDQNETVEDIKIYFTVNVTCTDQVKHQEMWSCELPSMVRMIHRPA